VPIVVIAIRSGCVVFRRGDQAEHPPRLDAIIFQTKDFGEVAGGR
jgi:hypothetical protein